MARPFRSVPLCLTLAIALVTGCDNSGDVTGTITLWDGTYVGEVQGLDAGAPEATLELGQNGRTLTGTLEVGGRTASLQGTVDELDEVDGTFTFTGECPGTASTEAQFHVDRILGSIEGTDDCGGSLNGTYNLMRQS